MVNNDCYHDDIPFTNKFKEQSYLMDDSAGSHRGKRGIIGPKIEENRRFLHVLVIYS